MGLSVGGGSQAAVRTLGGLLYEFAMPGFRRNVPCIVESMSAADARTVPRHVSAAAKYRRVGPLLRQFETLYRHSAFVEYIRQVQDHPTVLAPNYPHQPALHAFHNKSHDEQDLVDLYQQVSFVDHILPDYRAAYHIYNWLHAGNNTYMMGNTSRRRAAYAWLIATDAARCDALAALTTSPPREVHASSRCTVDASKHAFGHADYVTWVNKRLVHLMWVCEQPFHHHGTTTTTRNNKPGRPPRPADAYHLTLQKHEARYLVELYQLPQRVDYTQD